MKLNQATAVCVLAACGVAAALLWAACGDSFNHPPPPKANDEKVTYTPDEQTFLDDAVALQARPGLDLKQVTVQFVLIANGLVNASGSKPNLSLAQALERAADVYKRAKAGADFDKLVLNESYGRLVAGQRPGTFTLLRDKLPPNMGPATFLRTQQDTSVWKAAWRLKPGEIGPVEQHEKDANSGYYVVRRLTEDEIKRDNPANFPAPNPLVQAMRDAAKALLAKPEHKDARVKVQHILIARYMTSADGKHPILQPAEAEKVAAKLYAEAIAEPGKFKQLAQDNTYDQKVQYLMVADKKDATEFQAARSGMVEWFGDAAWRLKVGEVGVILYDSGKSPYGYHIIKRIE